MDVGTRPRASTDTAVHTRKRHFVRALAVVCVCATLPALPAHLDKRRTANMDEVLQVLRDAIRQHHDARGSYPPTLGTLVDSHYLRSIPKDPVLDRNDAWKLTLVTVDGVTGIRDVHSSAPGGDRAGRPWASR